MSADRIFARKTLDQREHSEQKAVFSGAPSVRLLGLNLSDMHCSLSHVVIGSQPPKGPELHAEAFGRWRIQNGW